MYRNADKPENPPEDFPKLKFANLENYSKLAQDLLWRHTIPYGPEWDEWLDGEGGFPKYPELPSGAKATLWDGWMCEAELWQGTETDGIYPRLKASWKRALLNRRLDGSGYVETKQGVFYAHNRGWPFPYYKQEDLGVGWIFTYKNQAQYYAPEKLDDDSGFEYNGILRRGISAQGLELSIHMPDASIELPELSCDTFRAPFLQIRWCGEGMGEHEPYLEWVREGDNGYDAQRRMYFEACPPERELTCKADYEERAFAMLPLYKHPLWNGTVKRVRLCVGNRRAGGRITLLSVFTQSDSRHNINNVQYLKGCCAYFNATRDLDFLRRNIGKMRTALAAFQYEHHTLEELVVKTTWVGHDGSSGAFCDAEGKTVRKKGAGLTSNWMDNQPYGGYDSYCSAYYYQAVLKMAELEEMIRRHPEWGVDYAYQAFEAEELRLHASRVKARFNELFWDDETGRFYATIDLEGNPHPNANIMANLEILYSGIATEAHERSVLDWISGRRTVAGDDAQGDEIYQYRFAPLISTKKNRDFLLWYQRTDLPFGTELQDGGCVLMVSYFDLMTRCRIYGADNAWERLKQILDWYGEVRSEGGYKNYFHNRGLTLQGEGDGGNIGITAEFFESQLPMCAVLFGLLGYYPLADRLVFTPRIPEELGTICVTNVAWRTVKMDICADLATRTVTIEYRGQLDEPLVAEANGGYQIELRKNDGGKK